MFDQPEAAVLCGVAVVALWLLSMTREPKPGPVLTMTYGLGLVVTTFWWPREHWWHAAIALMWIGVAMVTFGLISLLVKRRRHP